MFPSGSGIIGKNLSLDIVCRWKSGASASCHGIHSGYSFDASSYLINGSHFAFGWLLGGSQSKRSGSFQFVVLIRVEHNGCRFLLPVYPVFCDSILGSAGNYLDRRFSKYFGVYDLFAIWKKYYPWVFSKLFGYGYGYGDESENENAIRLR